jgi:E3 ubiquitin-protein ligase RGLG
MGQLITKLTSQKKTKTIPNRYESMEQLTQALREAGLEKCNLLVAIDFTKSNTWQGEKTFGGKNLHHIPQKGGSTTGGYEPVIGYEPVEGEELNIPGDEQKYPQKSIQLNPYQQVLQIIQKPLNEFDEDKRIPTCIFGHTRNRNQPYVCEIFDSPHNPDKIKGCHGLEGVLAAYEQAVQEHTFSGGTFFCPVLDWAQRIVAANKNEYHILVILGDGCIEDMKETQNLLKELSKNTPLSIVFVGVGDGSDPNKNDKWEKMRKLDDEPTGDCDIWQSVYLANILPTLEKSKHPDVELATLMLMEIPEQYKYFQKSGLIH